MKTRMRMLTVTACVAGLVVTAAVASATARSIAAPPSTGAGPVVSAVHSGVPDSACVEDAVGQLPAAAAKDSRWVEIWKSNPASQAPDHAARSLNRVAAVDAARIVGSAGKEGAATTPSDGAAVRVSYARAAASIGDDATEGIVSPNRCVWLVTVKAPFTPRSAPYGFERRTYDSYTMVFDVGTGQYLATAAGPAAPDVLSGHNVAGVSASN